MEYYDFLDRVVGISIIQRTNEALQKIVCHGYVFNQYEWYTTIDTSKVLLDNTRKCLQFLKSKGFTVTNKVAVGHFVVYHTTETVGHFGRVESVSESGEITVISKFGPEHIFRHRTALVKHEYGNSVTFLKPPN